jgi:RNA polymerase sigma-70 factor (ECF subfamily)
VSRPFRERLLGSEPVLRRTRPSEGEVRPFPAPVDASRSGTRSVGNVRQLSEAADRPKPAELDDAALVAPARAGEDWAAEEIWRRFSRLVRGVVQRTLGPGEDSSDLVQESFLQLFGALGQLRDPSSLRCFLIGITIRVVHSELRRRRVRRFLRLTPTGVVPEEATEGRDDDAREALRRLYAALDRLGDEDRIVFALRYFEGLELTDVAASVGISLATVKRKLQKVTTRVTALAMHDPLLSAYIVPDTEGVDP